MRCRRWTSQILKPAPKATIWANINCQKRNTTRLTIPGRSRTSAKATKTANASASPSRTRAAKPRSRSSDGSAGPVRAGLALPAIGVNRSYHDSEARNGWEPFRRDVDLFAAMNDSSKERDYVLGTHENELERLGVQHRAWREVVLDCWRNAGIGVGGKVLDVGAGPGYATVDLAEIVGPAGKVVAVERST